VELKLSWRLSEPMATLVSKTGTIESRKEHFGENNFPPPYIKSIWELIMENFEDTINLVLLGAALVSVAIGLFKEGMPRGLIEGTSIAIALVIIISVNSINNWNSEQKLAKLVLKSAIQECKVIREGGDLMTVDSGELVVGDLIDFKDGDKIPADLLMVQGQ